MGLFSKKLDYEYDSLQCKFDLETDEYYFSIKGEKLTEKQLNFKSRRFLKKQIE